MAVSPKKVLIVEDELLIADRIQGYLREAGYDTCEPAISFIEALARLRDYQPDIALLDIRLEGKRTGLDVARHLKAHGGPPFVFLTSQFDEAHVERVVKTRPAGYLTKPIQRSSLLSTLAVALHNTHRSSHGEAKRAITIDMGSQTELVPPEDVMYVRADHVYMTYLLADGRDLMVRDTLANTLAGLPEHFLQIHRSYIVNLDNVKGWSSSSVRVGSEQLPLSRRRREAFEAAMIDKGLADRGDASP